MDDAPSLPFDRDEVTAEEAVAQNRDAPRRAHPRTILFLRNLRELSWSVAASASGTILREEVDDGDARRVRLLHGVAADAEEWLVFDQPVELVDGRPPNRVEIASSASQRDAGIASWSQTEPSWSRSSHESRDASRFPDSRPVCSDPARDNVREGNAVNERLVDELAALTVRALPRSEIAGSSTSPASSAFPSTSKSFPRGPSSGPCTTPCAKRF